MINLFYEGVLDVRADFVSLRAFFATFVVCVLCANIALAQPIPETCDPDYKAVLDARAWMGGKRDMESAQTLIGQGSVLSLSCFSGQVTFMGVAANSLFSDNVRSPILFNLPPLAFFPNDIHQPTIISPPGPNPPGGMTAQTLDIMLARLVLASLAVHLANIRPGAIPASAGALCSSMAGVWRDAKCTNVNDALWITLEAHRTTDRRNFGCGDRGRWNTRWNTGYPAPGGTGALDAATSYRNFIVPGASPNCGGVQPVPTGMTVNIRGAGYPDAVCPPVGCWYNPQNNTCNN